MMKLTTVGIERDARHVRLVARVDRDRGREPLEPIFEYPRADTAFLHESADAFVPALLVPCMMAAEPLEIVPPISAKLHGSLDTIRTILSQWWPELHRVEVAATPTDPGPGPLGRTSASFFSGGVDSFYTCIKHAARTASPSGPRFTHLVHMEGVEKPLEESVDSSNLRKGFRRVADRYGLDVVFGRTNIRSIFPLSWSLYYHGAGLASVAHSLGCGFERVLVPATHSFRHLFPWGSHPLLDPLWSTERTEIAHDGCEVTRVDKTILVAADPLALEHLRVCIRNQAGPGNCGRCTKCVRTMVTLLAIGALRRAKTFPGRLPANFDHLLPLGTDNDRAFVEEILGYLEDHDTGRVLARTLSAQIRQSRRHAATRSYVRNSNLAAALPAVRKLRGAAHRVASIVHLIA